MKKISLIIFLCVCIYNVNGQVNNDIIIGKIDSINSKILDEERKLLIYVPDANTDSIYDPVNFPVLYLLDGDHLFYPVVRMIQHLSSFNGNTICPKMIVVGIPNTNRTRDLTPTKSMPDPPFVSSEMAETSGGGVDFISFIEKELIPYTDANYPTNPYRMFVGYSLGGLTVMNTFVHHPNLFDSYVAIDPSMWWDNKKLLKQIETKTFDKSYTNKKLFLGIANTMNEGMDTSSVQKDTTFSTKHMRAILKLNSSLNSKTQLSFKSKYYKDDDHGSIPFIAEYDALRYIFSFYQLKIDNEEFFNPESDIVSKVENHYKIVSKEFGIKMKPDEAYVNGLGLEYMWMGQFEKAKQLLELNVKNYPKSFNTYDSLGDVYAEMGDTEKAIENYKKSLSLNKDSFSKEKLIKLENK